MRTFPVFRRNWNCPPSKHNECTEPDKPHSASIGALQSRRDWLAPWAAVLIIIALLGGSVCVPAQIKVTFGRKKPVTMKDLDQQRNTSPLFKDGDLLAKVHTVAILTVAGPTKVHLGFKSMDSAPLLDRAEKQLVDALRASGFTVQPLEQTRQIASREWLSTYIDAMPPDQQEALQNLSQEEKEAYFKQNAQKLCDNPLTRVLFGCPSQNSGGDPSAGGGGDQSERSSTGTLYLRSMAAKPIPSVAEMQRGSSLLGDDGSGQVLGPVSLRVAGELAEKLQVDAVIVLTLDGSIETNKPVNHFGSIAAAQSRDFAVENVRLQAVNSAAQFVFAECIREVNPEALARKMLAVTYDSDMVMGRLSESVDKGVGKEAGHFAGKPGGN